MPITRSLHLLITIVLALALVFSSNMVAFAQSSSPQNTISVLVQFSGPVQAGDRAFVRSLGAAVTHEYALVPAMAIEIPEKALRGLQNNPRIALVEEDMEVQAMAAITPINDITDEYGETWSIANIKAKTVHDSGNTGATVKIGIVDSGISNTHPDLKIVGEFDFVNNSPTSNDVYGHGTHVAGTACGIFNGFGVVGVAPSCDLYDLRVLNDAGSGYTSDILAAVEWAVANKLDVINLSLGSSRDPGSTAQAVYDAAYNAGVLIVAAAGNSGQANGRGINTIYPANYTSVIAVAATDSKNVRAYFSSTGPNVEIAAPGLSVHSAWNDSTSPADPQPNCIGSYGCYKDASGTSMASPQVAGVAALVIAAGVVDKSGNGHVNDEVRAILQSTAVDLGNAGRDTWYGYGLVDASAAVASVGPVGPQAPVANAGSDQMLTDADNDGGEVTTLDASASYDPDGSIFSYEWDLNADGTTDSTDISTTTTFSIGRHTVTLKVTDNEGNIATDEVVITIDPYVEASFTLSAVGYKVKGDQKVDLSWTGFNTDSIDIYRSGALLTSTSNDGAHTDNINIKGGGSYTYEVCEAGSKANCSAEVVVSF